MPKKIISVQSRKQCHRLFEKDIHKIFYVKTKGLPQIPCYYNKTTQKFD